MVILFPPLELITRGGFGEMMETQNVHHNPNPEPLDDSSYANQNLVDNDISTPRDAAFGLVGSGRSAYRLVYSNHAHTAADDGL
jgi:hypothetical protein